jgi:hypothetical protein
MVGNPGMRILEWAEPGIVVVNGAIALKTPQRVR